MTTHAELARSLAKYDSLAAAQLRRLAEHLRRCRARVRRGK